MIDDDEQGPLLADDQFRDALSAMQDHVAIGAAVRDAAGAIEDFVLIYLNDPSVDGAGRRAHELQGQRVREIYPSWVQSGLFDAFASVVETGEPYVADRLAYDDVAPDGTVIAGHWSLSVARFGDGYIAASRDVTHLVVAEREQQAAEREVDRNRTAVALLQRAALPTTLPEVAGVALAASYTPAIEAQPVGGDWYDAFDLGDGRVGLVIADVAGHGPDAASFMVQVRNVVRALAIEHQEPGVVLTRVNAVLLRFAESPLFATCCYGVLDAASRTFSFALAGHPPPAHVGALTGYPTAEVGPPLGVQAGFAYGTALAHLEPGDRIVLFTDGLVEVRGRSIATSLDELAGWLDEMAHLDLEQLVAAMAGRRDRREDDVAVLVAHLIARATVPESPGLVH